jgi:hypothetical protein
MGAESKASELFTGMRVKAAEVGLSMQMGDESNAGELLAAIRVKADEVGLSTKSL